ncbi:MAG: glycerol-3-phosphate 1-O-acyltransferase PlsY [Oscillospiraceae bacterium]|nr:glycerol-3-phosphate 1-O-acyltransferase PlsY [Oscillospiraceae bacterium]
MDFVISALVVFSGYLLGSVSFSVIIARIFAQKDIREYGSGNAGATNVIRTIGPIPGALTFLLDFLKGMAAIAIARWAFGGSIPPAGQADQQKYLIYAGLAAISVMTGHMFPVFFRFKGGKAVSTAGGILFMLFPEAAWILLVVFIIVLLLTRTVSIASCSIAILLPFIEPILNATGVVRTDHLLMRTVIAAVMCGIVVYTHRANIRRIIDGTEPQLFSFDKKEKENAKG